MAATVGTIATVASVGSSLYGMVSGSQAAGSASDAASSAADAQTLIAAKQADLAQAQWDRYLATFAPLENALVSEVQKPARESAGFLAQMGSINRNYADSGANIRSMMGGKNPYGSGASYGAQRSNELNRTKALSSAESTWNQNRLGNMMSVANLGRNLSTNAASGYSGASSGYGNAAGTYGSLAQMYGSAASSAGSSLGSGLGNLYQSYLYSQPSNNYYDSALQTWVNQPVYH